MRVLRGCARRRSPGQILIIAALVMVLVLGLVGAGVDYGLILVEETKTQHAADAAALAAARVVVGVPTPGVVAAQSTATEYLRLHGFEHGVANTTITYGWATPAPSGPTDRATINIARTKPTLFWNVIGINNVQIRGQATARGTGGGMPDIVFSLDQTNMSSGDMTKLKDALSDFVAQLQPNTSEPRGPRIGIAIYRGETCPGTGTWAWGENSAGQLGRGTTTDDPNPALASTGGTPFSIAAGTGHSLAAQFGGSSPDMGWGDNSSGQLGDFTFTSQYVPIAVLGALESQVAMAAGANHSMMLRADGTVWAWGENGSGQLGQGDTVDSSHPEQGQVLPLTGVAAIAAGANHSLALQADGTVWAWGDNSSGQLGPVASASPPSTYNPQALLPAPWGTRRITAIAAGGRHSLALASDGRVFAWGENGSGQLGDGTTTNRTTPALLGSPTNVKEIAAGGNHSLALGTDERVRAWGANGSGQLGDATTINRTSAVLVSGLEGVDAISAGDAHSLALLLDDEEVWAWGANGSGQLGSPPPTGSTIPVRVLGLPSIYAISAGANHNLATAAGSCRRDAHVLRELTAGSTVLQQVIDGPPAGCPGLPAQPPSSTAPLSATSYMCDLKAVGGARRYIRIGLQAALIPGSWDLWGPAKGGRAEAKKILVLMADGRNRPSGRTEATANTNTISAASAVKLGADQIAASPLPAPDDVEVYVVGFFGGGESGLTGSSPPGCPNSTLPAGRTSVDDMLISVSSSTSGSCDHYYPLDKSADLSPVFTAMALRIARGLLLN